MKNRIKVYRALRNLTQEVLADQQPYIFLYVPYSLPAVSSRIKGIVPAPAGITYNLEKWYVPKAYQKYTTLQ